MKTILTLKYGTKYSSQAVNSIYEHTEGKYNYICVTDDPKGLHPDIKVIYIEHEPNGNMEKLKLFQIKADPGDVIMYLDLDIRIQKNLDHLFDYCQHYPVIAYTWWKDKGIDEMPGFDKSYREFNMNTRINGCPMFTRCSNFERGLYVPSF